MKKALALALTLCLALCGASALAAGELTVKQETYTAVEGYSIIGYIFAELENTGDTNVEFSSAVLEILSSEGAPTASGEIYSMYPAILAPGETGYLYSTEYVDEATSLDDIADHSLSVMGKTTQDEAPARLDSSAEYTTIVNAWDEEENVVLVTVTNSGEETVYDFECAVGLYDGEGKLLWVGTDTAYNMGLPAGQSVELVFSLDLDEVWEENDITPATAQSIVYAE